MANVLHRIFPHSRLSNDFAKSQILDDVIEDLSPVTPATPADFRSVVIQNVLDLKEELENSHANIISQAQDHIHSKYALNGSGFSI